MRLAIFSDVHGNLIALEAVLADIRPKKVDGYLVLGDLSAIGYDPIGPLERLSRLPDALFIRGNTDRFLVTGELPPPTVEDVQRDPSKAQALLELSRSFAFTYGHVMAKGWHNWLAALPLEYRLTLPDGTRLLAVHAAPGTDDGPGMQPTMSDEQLLSLVVDSDADLIFVGHTHWQQDRKIDSKRMVNPGSVSNPFQPDLMARYAILETHDTGYRLDLHSVDYDHEAVIEAVRESRHPAGEYIIRFQKGLNRPPWEQPSA